MPEVLRFARRAAAKVKPDEVDRFLSVMKGEVYPKLLKEKGLRRVYLLRGTSNRDEFVSLTLWNSKLSADKYESSGDYARYVGLVQDFLEESIQVSQFEVVYHSVSPSLPSPKGGRRKRTTRKR